MEPVIKRQNYHIWDFAVGHSRLNLRHTDVDANDGSTRNIDIIFSGVEYMELPDILEDLVLDSPTEEELAYLAGRCRFFSVESKCHVLVAGGRRYYVVAGGPHVEENTLPLFTSFLEAEKEEE